MTAQQTSYAEAVAAAGQVYAEAIARQDARPPREAAREALGKAATAAELQAWIAEFRGARRG